MASKWAEYEDGFIIPGSGLLLCKCTKICHGAGEVNRRTWAHHHVAEASRPSRRAVPSTITTSTASGSKEARPRSNSDEISGTASFEMQSFAMDIENDSHRDNPHTPALTVTPTIQSMHASSFSRPETPPSQQSIEELNLSDGEGFNFEPFVLPDNDSDSDSEPENAQDDLLHPILPPARPPSPPSRPPSPTPPNLAPTSRLTPPVTKFMTPPSWRSIPTESVKVEKLKVSLQFIEALESACKENSQLLAEDNEKLWNPPCHQIDLKDPAYRQALHTFIGADAPISEETYNAFRRGHQERYPQDPLPSFWKTKKKLEELTGVRAIETDMCPNSCIAYTGPFANLDKCSYSSCGEPRYDPAKLRRGQHVARAKFWTIPIGPYVQALWRHPETAEELKYRRRHTTTPDIWEDIFDGTDYQKLVADGFIKPEDTLLLFSIDGAQLYAHKLSDCWIYIWVLLDLRPGLRYKKKFVVPGGFIPGPHAPKNTDSFTFVGFHHLAVIQREGLPIWDSSTNSLFISHLFLLLSTADGPGQQHMSGSNGHTARIACRFFCGIVGRHRFQAPQYYPAALAPSNPPPGQPIRGDVNLQRDLRDSPSSPASIEAYNTAIARLLASKSKAEYTRTQTEVGYGKPSILSGLPRCLPPPAVFPGDLMHYILNIGDLLSGLWTGKLDKVYAPDHNTEWNWRVLVGDAWTQHGAAVASSHHYLPGNYDRVPRNPAEKINSGYKAKEWQHWLFGLAPALLYGLLPPTYWANFCKLVHVVRVLHKRRISKEDLIRAYKLVLEFSYEFETIYYARRIERVHFVRHSIHTPLHMVQEIRRIGNLILYAQWTLERTIGNLGGEIHQPSLMFANLSQRGVYRAQVNALKAMDPSFDTSATSQKTVPTGVVDIGDGYQLRPRLDSTARAIETADELNALSSYLSSRWDTPFDATKDNSRIKRWARLALPDNGQTARSRFGESESNRVTRMVQFPSNLPEGFEIGEVLYFFRYNVEENEPTALAMVSVFGVPDREILKDSFGTVWAARPGEAGIRVIPAKTIETVVAMIPFSEKRGVSPEAELRFQGKSYLYERMGLGSSFE